MESIPCLVFKMLPADVEKRLMCREVGAKEVFCG